MSESNETNSKGAGSEQIGNTSSNPENTEALPTQEEWLGLISQAQRRLPSTDQVYNAPEPGTIEFAQYIDHTLLKLDATKEQIDQLCDEAKKYQFKSVCVRLPWVSHAVSLLHDSSITVACVIGFHEGTHATAEKVVETQQALQAGALELDMVLNHPLLASKAYQSVHADILAVRNAAPPPTVLKVILETSQLSREDIIAGCVIAKAAGADFVKTSTGFCGAGATAENVALMKAVVGDQIAVKASGGVRTAEDCVRMMEAGAGRIGASAGVAIMREGKQQKVNEHDDKDNKITENGY